MERQMDIPSEYFGQLLPYVMDKNITDIDYNGTDVWITNIHNECKKLDIVLDKLFLEQFCSRIANLVSLQFNPGNPILEAETKELRISIGHEEIAKSGRTICIRKSYPEVRFSPEEAIESGYMSEEALSFFVNCVRAEMRFVICGLTGAGKTELIKFLLQFIPKHERVITIEDNLEIHYGEICPGANHVELKVGENFNYSDAIKFALRQHPKRIILSEARGEEAKDLISAWSTGASGFSTIHTDSVKNIPDRMLNMIPNREDAERTINDVYRYVDIGVLVRIQEKNGKKCRVIDQVCAFDRVHRENKIHVLIDEEKIVNKSLPQNLISKFSRHGIKEPWKYQFEL